MIKSWLSRMKGGCSLVHQMNLLEKLSPFCPVLCVGMKSTFQETPFFFWLIILQSGLRSVHCKPGGFFSHLYSSSLGYLPGRKRSRAILVLLMLFYCPSFLCNYILILTQPKKKTRKQCNLMKT